MARSSEISVALPLSDDSMTSDFEEHVRQISVNTYLSLELEGTSAGATLAQCYRTVQQSMKALLPACS